MDEFGLIETFFSSISIPREDVILGIGDDAACLYVPEGQQLVVSTDTLVSGVHFLPEYSPYDIASKAVRVNISDMAAMGAEARWMTLALTIPILDEVWLRAFSNGLKDTLQAFDVALVGGDTTRGPLTITLTIHGTVLAGKAITRSGAKAGDRIYVTGALGLAACALTIQHGDIPVSDSACMLEQLHHPTPRVDWVPYLQTYGHAAIDISDGLVQDLQHICQASHLGATLELARIPIHPLLKQYLPEQALKLALSGGDDYQLCFTVGEAEETVFLHALKEAGIVCYLIGMMESLPGLRLRAPNGSMMENTFSGYHHF